MESTDAGETGPTQHVEDASRASKEAKTPGEDDMTSNYSGHADIESNNNVTEPRARRRGLFPMNERQLAYEPPRMSSCACAVLILIQVVFCGGFIFWLTIGKDLIDGGNRRV